MPGASKMAAAGAAAMCRNMRRLRPRPRLADDVHELDADRGSASAVVEKLTAPPRAPPDRRRDYANRVRKLQPRGCNFLPVVGELADDVRELPPDVKLLADDRGKHEFRLWEHAADVWELPHSGCPPPPPPVTTPPPTATRLPASAASLFATPTFTLRRGNGIFTTSA